MKAVMVMFDSLNRHMLPPYNPQTWVHAPNFRRLAQRSVTFDKSYVCSMPCMPARRDFHTGRPNFLHCGWGPLEPFDDSVPQMLSDAGVYTHLDTDHYHYFEDGGATYHNRYDSWTFHRGQEGDPYIGHVADPPIPDHINGKGRKPDWVNRLFQVTDEQMPQTRCFDAGKAFIHRNAAQDNWFLQIECFDPHEPFCTDPKYKDLYPSDYDGPLFDWPGYQPVSETPEQVKEAQRNYAALMSRCDHSIGQILDLFDQHNLWEDTMLIVWTDHGFLLGEHGCWAKNWMPLYEEISHTPFFVYDPTRKQAAGQRRSALVQPAIDLGPTLLRFFGLEPTPHMLGHDLAGVLADDTPVRDAAIFGYHNSRVNITDGRYAYYRDAVCDAPCPVHTLMPTNMRLWKTDIANAELSREFAFTRGMPLLRFQRDRKTRDNYGDHLLFDLGADPAQEHPLRDEAVEDRLCRAMAGLMEACEAPADQYARMGVGAGGA